MGDVFAKRSDWLVKVGKLCDTDIMTIHPLDGLTGRMIIDALAAQRLLYKRPGQPAFNVRQHGTKIFIQRNPD
jgi:hypothetical protein